MATSSESSMATSSGSSSGSSMATFSGSSSGTPPATPSETSPATPSGTPPATPSETPPETPSGTLSQSFSVTPSCSVSQGLQNVFVTPLPSVLPNQKTTRVQVPYYQIKQPLAYTSYRSMYQCQQNVNFVWLSQIIPLVQEIAPIYINRNDPVNQQIFNCSLIPHRNLEATYMQYFVDLIFTVDTPIGIPINSPSPPTPILETLSFAAIIAISIGGCGTIILIIGVINFYIIAKEKNNKNKQLVLNPLNREHSHTRNIFSDAWHV